jgi:hypothetical protein
MSGQKITFSSADIQGAPETFSEADIAARPVSQPAAPAPEQPGAVRRFLGGAAQMLLPSTTPSDYIKGPMYVARHPLDSLGLLAGAIKDAHAAQFQKAKTAGSEGRYSEMLGHGWRNDWAGRHCRRSWANDWPARAYCWPQGRSGNTGWSAGAGRHDRVKSSRG